MEDIIEALREANEDSASPMELPDDDLLVEIEEALLIQIPHDLRVYLLEVSDVLCGDKEPVTVTDSRSHTYLPEVAALAWDQGMPREFLPVCEYDGGFAYVEQDGTAGFWSIRDATTTESWETFWHWVQEKWLP